MGLFGRSPEDGFQVIPLMGPQQPNLPVNVIQDYNSFLTERDRESCLLLYSSKIAGAHPLDSVVFLTLASNFLGHMRRNGCKNLWFHLTGFGGDIRTADAMKKLLNDLGFEEVRVIAPLRLGATASLITMVIYDKLYVNSNTIIDPFNITVQVAGITNLDLNTFLEVMDFLMKSPSKEVEDAIRTQAYSLMLSSGALFGYVEATKERKFVSEIIETYIYNKLKVHESEFEELFLGTEDKVATLMTGKRLVDVLKNVVLMDEEDPELSKKAIEVEEALQSFFEQSGTAGLLATPTKLTTFNAVPVPPLGLR